MTAFANKAGKRHFIMTDSAVFSLEYLGHIDIVGALLFYKNTFMAILAGEPFGMCFMRKQNIIHFTCIFHDDVRVKQFHWSVAAYRTTGFDFSVSQRENPVNLSFSIHRKACKRVIGFLQCFIYRVVSVIKSILTRD